MARRRATTVLQEAAAAGAAAAIAAADGNGDEVLPLATSQEEEEIAEDVLEGLRRLDSGGNRVTWYVYSEQPGTSGNSEGYIEKLKSEQLDEARFKNVYGPGEYRIVGRTKDGAYVRGSHKVIRISDIGAARRSGETDAVSMLREMRATEEQRAAKRAEDMRTYAQILAAPLATLGAALIARKPSIDIAALVTALRPQQSSLGEMTTALVNLKQLEGNGASNLDVALKVLDKLQDLPTGAGGDTGWLGFFRDLVKEAAPAAREIIGQLAQPARPGQFPPGGTNGPPFMVTQQPPPAIAPPPPTPSAVSSPGAAVPPPATTNAPSGLPLQSEELDMWRAAEPWLRRKADEILEAASTNMPIDLEAECLLIAFDKKFKLFVSRDDMKSWLSHPDWWTYVVAFSPPLQPYQAWVDDLRQELLAMLADEEKPGQEDEAHD